MTMIVRIRHARMLDGLGNPAQDNVTIEVAEGHIAAITPDPGTALGPSDVDAAGRTVLPGFVNLHSHLLRRKRADDPATMTTVAEVVRALRNAREALAQGITTARELGARDHLDLQLRDLIDAGGVPGPRIFASGRPITRTGGHNCDFSHEADGPDEVRKAARLELKAGADVLKVMASWGGIETGLEHRRLRLPGDPAPAAAAYTIEEMRAAVEEAHAVGKRVTVHAESSQSVLRAIAAGVDSIEHGTHLTGEAVRALAETRIPLVPTISTVFKRVADADRRVGVDWGSDVMSWARLATRPWMESLRRAIAAGVPIATGTDAGGDIATEIALLVEAGLQPIEALRSATSLAAETLGRTDLGAVEAGRWADLVVVDGYPDVDLGALRAVRCVIKAGSPHDPQELLLGTG
ncbi:MAG: amidohydrolase family protein [Candidatus Limnocylindria bacterium]